MPAIRKTRVRSLESDDEGAALVSIEHRRVVQEVEYVHPYFAAARAETSNTQAQPAEQGNTLGQVMQSTQSGETHGGEVSSQSSESSESSEDEGDEDETDRVYIGPGPETLMGRILRWETDAQELQAAGRQIVPFPEGEQLRMPPLSRGLSDAHLAIYGSRPPTPHPFFEHQSYHANSSSSTAPPTTELEVATGNVRPTILSQHSTCPHGAHRTGSPTPSSAPSESDPDPACGVCYRRSVDVQLVGCNHWLCGTCTRRTYFASQKHFNNWPLGIDCPFCRRDVRFVKTSDDSGRMRRLPLWVVRWSIKGRTRVMRAHKGTVEPEEMRGYVGFMQEAITLGRYPTLTNPGAANSVIAGAPTPPAGPVKTGTASEGRS